MKTKRLSFWLGAIFLVLMVMAISSVGAWGAQNEKAKLPNKVIIGTHPIGSVYNLIGAAVAGVIGAHTPMKALVKANAGTSAWLVLMDSKEVDLGIMGQEIYDAYYGIWGFEKTRHGKGFNVCLLQMGHKNTIGFAVRDNSNIKTLADLKGKRVLWGLPTMPNVAPRIAAQLKLWGLNEGDYTKVPFNDLLEATRALGEGAVDVTWIIPSTPVFREVNSQTPLRFLDDWHATSKDDPGILTRIQGLTGTWFEVVKAGSLPGVRKDTIMSQTQTVLAVRKDLSDEAVYLTAKALWENYKELAPVYPPLVTWCPENMVTVTLNYGIKGGAVPYHPGAVKLYKEVGAWTPAVEKYQQDAMAGR